MRNGKLAILTMAALAMASWGFPLTRPLAEAAARRSEPTQEFESQI